MRCVLSQVLLVLTATAACSSGADTPQEAIRRNVRFVQRLEQTCCEYHGDELPALITALGREATALFELYSCDAGLDSVFFAAAMQKTQPQPCFGIQAGVAEAAVRDLSESELALVRLKDAKLVCMMVSVTNLADSELDLSGMTISVELDGLKATEALNSNAPELSGLPDNVRRLALLPKIRPHAAGAFIAFFPRFNRWTALTLAQHDTLNICVRNYIEMPQYLNRVLAERDRAAKFRRQHAAPSQEPDSQAPKPAVPKFELVGYIRNQVQLGRYGIRLVKTEPIAPETRLLVRRNDATYAELTPVGSGTIGALVSGDEPEPGDAVYIEIHSEVKK